IFAHAFAVASSTVASRFHSSPEPPRVTALRRALLFLISGFSLAAQVNTGRIVGLATGAGNAKLAGVRIGAVLSSTGFAVETVTNAAGSYLLPNLQAGEWDVSVGASGLGPAQQRV